MYKSTLTLITVFSCLLLNGQILFEDEAAIRGMTLHTGTIGNGNGITFVDYNNDGWDDITLPSGNGVPLRFYKNIGGFFVEESLITPQITYQVRAVSWVDYDNDGDKDIFITSDTNGNRLYRNNDDGSFTNVTIASGLFEDNVFTYGISWGDVNNDGCLDLYLSNRSVDSVITNYFFKNNCDGTFTNFTEQSGLNNDPALTFCASFFDFNNDGWQDLYVSNDKIYPNFLYINDGDGTYTDVSEITNSNIVVDAMSVTVDDYNNDGYFDIYITNTPNDLGTETSGSILLKNDNGVQFTDVSIGSGTQLDSWSWGANFLDADNDTDLDLYVSCQYTQDDNFPTYGFYDNKSDGTYSQLGSFGFQNNEYRSYGSATGDVNNDGKVDIAVINNLNTVPNLWMNNSSSVNNYLIVNLLGVVSNRDGLGSVIEISVANKKQYRYVTNGESYLSQNSLQEFFGVGNATTVDYVKVKWLSGIEDIIYNVNVNNTLKITEGNTLSLANPNNDIELTAYINQISKTVNIASNTLMEQIDIINIAGQKINSYEVNSNNLKADINSFSKGIYLLKIHFKGNNIVIKKIAIF
ncbi:FG-GAP-like repeat-containing protein [uncultured Winogradskyella sp.]|uniref:FG-GAP-like repeat-containing protein n=1 Tax=uncultured Winogradskyella sp. TaxID=395353 RepID=UPI00260C5B6F|nr:FG-GAP-like repeat-containing protein [uncultured Winogradskyella sp.]